MAATDMPREELERYVPARDEPADFDDFWSRTFGEAATQPMQPEFAPVDAGLRTVEVHDVTFPGYGGDPVKGWLVRPAGQASPLPAVVTYVGYGGGRGLPHESLLYASAGYAHLVMDTRGQGAGWSRGDTADRSPVPLPPQHLGFASRGIGAPETYYYTRLATDAVRAVAAARAAPGVDPERVAVGGTSQGGGLALAAAAFAGGVAAALVDVPFLCHWRRGVEIATEGPYEEVAAYCAVHREHVDRVFTTLSYVDGMHFAARATVPALFSVALMDPMCPPSTVYAAYHHYAGDRQLRVYPYNGHEGGQGHQQAEHLAFLRDVFATG